VDDEDVVAATAQVCTLTHRRSFGIPEPALVSAAVGDVGEPRRRRLDGLELFLRRAGDTPLLSAPEERVLARRMAAGDETARQRLLKANLRLVISIAKSYRWRGLEFDDLIQEGFSGLNRASEKFDPGLGFRFSTYATQWIHHAIQRGVEHHGRTIAVPGHLSDRQRILRQVSSRLEVALGRSPSPTELETETGIELRKIIEALALPADATSLDITLHDRSDALGSSIADIDPSDPDDRIDDDRRRAAVLTALASLEPNERTVLTLRFGIVSRVPLSMEGVAARLGCSVWKVRRIEGDALRHLKPRLGQLLFEVVDTST
jgi:RNA polymerase sigma factor (sigma-70 family)